MDFNTISTSFCKSALSSGIYKYIYNVCAYICTIIYETQSKFISFLTVCSCSAKFLDVEIYIYKLWLYFKTDREFLEEKRKKRKEKKKKSSFGCLS